MLHRTSRSLLAGYPQIGVLTSAACRCRSIDPAIVSAKFGERFAVMGCRSR
jgi:hypothetical protein